MCNGTYIRLITWCYSQSDVRKPKTADILRLEKLLNVVRMVRDGVGARQKERDKRRSVARCLVRVVELYLPYGLNVSCSVY